MTASSRQPRTRPHRPRQQALRDVWAAVTADPCATVDTIAARTGYVSKGPVSELLRELRDYGYIDFNDRTRGARRILVPFVVTRSR
ncbi:MAG: hypothetical protein M3R24_40255 [Chloroflexota bacterium]|nr:hypothetical protein [Chloroflexota bacterium]